MIPALMVMLLTLICGFLPALNIVSEKEVGTIEQINVTPVPKFIFILAKLLPYWLIGFVVLTVCFILAWLIYGIVPVGHFLLIYFFRSSFRSGNVRFRTCYFQLLGNDATVYVCYVVLFVGCNFDEWFVYSH